ncbi:hypothetical protein CANTEDRAFT_117866 [Yamadazyma tenuis ATCC 10573]|uniref:Sugar phosphate transporter domain-containing protein n=1 Tax=Candida tenuis (strain ATCC 10573 / BCRC 21748 / CBS 615 / JCM 9827 / NBRC 10315 / NRRL Y-1498 / VKM Y-70) TaxID=590646 RepID=G3AX50_CANTC|nr:uncharacterized protein CANTEDRAFT_117866 [Yamadazyma tenuis ATCC 10573]EGV66878.1 hypothetical protein CANTEDRAFT_117866 [Yamadazyma tenuis ATCC 10573]
MILNSWLPPISVKTVGTCVIWYGISSLTSQLTKRILVEYRYPLFLSQFQFLTSSLLSLLFIVLVRVFPHIRQYFPTGSVPTDVEKPVINLGAFLKILPLGLFQFFGKYFALSATSLLSLAAVSSIRALSPLVIVSSYRFVYKIKFPLLTYFSLVPLLGGVILIITSEAPKSNSKGEPTSEFGFDSGQIKGFVFCFINLIIFAAQNIYAKQLITWDTDDTKSLAISTKRSESPFDSNAKDHKYIRQRNNSIRLPYSTSDLKLDEKNEDSAQSTDYSKEVQTNKFNLGNPFASFISDSDKITKPDQITTIFYCSMIGFFISVTGFLLNELPHVLDILQGRLEDSTPDTKSGILWVFYLILLSSLFHFFQTLLAFHLLGSIPAVSYSIASLMKRIWLITVSIVMAANNHDPNKYFGKLTSGQLLGLLLTGFGLYCYDKWGSKAVKTKT